jgi:hypothetical protein
MIRAVKRIVVTDRGDDLERFMKGGYVAALSITLDKRLLFNAVHLTRSDGESGTTVAKIADRHRQRKGGAEAARPGGGRKPTTRMVIAKILERAGHEVTLVNDGEQAVEALARSPSTSPSWTSTCRSWEDARPRSCTGSPEGRDGGCRSSP